MVTEQEDWFDFQSSSETFDSTEDENDERKEENDKENSNSNNVIQRMYHTPNNKHKDGVITTDNDNGNDNKKIPDKKRLKKKNVYNLLANESPPPMPSKSNDKGHPTIKDHDETTATDNSNDTNSNNRNNSNNNNSSNNSNRTRNMTDSNVRSELFQNSDNDETNHRNGMDNDRWDDENDNDDVKDNEIGFDCYYTEEEERLIEQFWKWYDDIIFLSVFSILGVLFRLGSAKYVSVFGNNDETTSDDDAELFTTLPLNCLSCLIMGLLCSGEDAMHIIPRAWYFKMNNCNNNDDCERNMVSSNHDENDNMNIISNYDDKNKNENKKQFERLLGREEQREVQLAALERRIHASKSLVLFPAKKQHVDVMEHYNYNLTTTNYNNNRFEVLDDGNASGNDQTQFQNKVNQNSVVGMEPSRSSYETEITITNTNITDESLAIPGCDEENDLSHNHQNPDNNNNISNNMLFEAEVAFENLKVLITRVNVADGWDVGTTPDDMSDDLLLGLKVGFCGALSTFASWNSDMVSLIREGKIRLTFTGYLLGLALPMFCYRLGQHMALYIFIWRCHHETRRDERRGGYGIRIQSSSDDNDDESMHSVLSVEANINDISYGLDKHSYHKSNFIESSSTSEIVSNSCHQNKDHLTGIVSNSCHQNKDHLTGINITTSCSENPTSPFGDSVGSGNNATKNMSPLVNVTYESQRRRKHISKNDCATTSTDEALRREIPSVRAIATAIAVMILVLLLSALIFFQGKKSVQRYCIALLFSPFGVLARWKICQKWNQKLPMFPLGTFACNILGCALSGSLGSLLAGNPGPEESIVLVSMISGFAGSLSTLATFLVEVLNRIDPILFQLDGAQYALITVFWGMVIGLITNQATNWADEL